MSSSWLDSWGNSWSDSWGQIADVPGAIRGVSTGTSYASGSISFIENATEITAGSGHPSISAFVLPTGQRSKKRIDDSVADAMRELYEGITETAPLRTKKQAAKIVRPHIVSSVKSVSIPPASIIDWNALERDAARVSALLSLWQEQMENLEDEEMLLLLMAA